MRKELVLLLFILTGIIIQASGQVRTPFREKTDSFDISQVQRLAANKVYVSLTELFSVTDCQLLDMDKTRSAFCPNAYIQVTTLRSPGKKRNYSIPTMITRLWNLVCNESSTYNSVQYRISRPFPLAVQTLVRSDTCWATVPIEEIFIGEAKEQWRNYSDLTIRSAVVKFYHQDGVLHWKIDHIDAVSTQPYHPGKIQ